MIERTSKAVHGEPTSKENKKKGHKITKINGITVVTMPDQIKKDKMHPPLC